MCAVVLVSAATASGTTLYEEPPGSARESTPELKLPPPEWEPWDVEAAAEPLIDLPGMAPVALILMHRFSGEVEPPRAAKRPFPAPNLRVPELATSVLAAAGLAALLTRKRKSYRPQHT
jgi:hypothetical protein